MSHSHHPEAIAERLAAGPQRSYLKDFIFGGIDGAVTTFAVVAGVAGAKLGLGVVLILGLANILADGFSMAVSNFLGTRAENQRWRRLREEEFQATRDHPEGEREEIRQLFQQQGFTGDLLEQAVATITADRRRWVQTMLQGEYGLTGSQGDPWRAAAATYVAFIAAGAVALLPFFVVWLWPNGQAAFAAGDPFRWSMGLTALTFFGVGALKGWQLRISWWRGGLETLLLGGAAALLAYGVGVLLSPWLGGEAALP